MQVANEGGQDAGEGTTKPSRLRNFAMALVAVAAIVGYRLLPDDLALMITFGALAGVAAGLLPYFLGRHRNRKLAIGAVWLSAAIGAYGGIIMALPAAVVMALVLRFAIKPAPGAPAEGPAVPGYPTAYPTGYPTGEGHPPSPSQAPAVPGAAAAPGSTPQPWGQQSQPAVPGYSAQPGQAGQAGQVSQAGQAGHVGQPPQFGQATYPGQAGQSEQPAQPGQWPTR